MAKEQNLKLTIPITAVAVLLAAFGGTAGYNAILAPAQAHVVQIEDAPPFIKLEGQFTTHCSQQERDFASQRIKDEAQDRRTEAVNAGVDMLSQGVAGIAADTQTLKGQMTEIQKDIKDLLRRQGESR